MFLSGIYYFKTGFPLKDCGNDMLNKQKSPEKYQGFFVVKTQT